MITHHYIRKFLGQHVQCHTHYGTFQGVIVNLTKHHIILGVVPAEHHPRQMPMGPGGPMGPGPGGPMGPGGGWHMAIPLAAIIGITALGMHWW